jgi:hypothetical protein
MWYPIPPKRTVLFCGLFLSALFLLSAGPLEERLEIIVVSPPAGGSAGTALAAKAGTALHPAGGSNSGAGLCRGWPLFLGTPGAGFPYTPTLHDADGDGADEIFLTGGHTFGIKGDGSFLPGWPTAEMQYMGYGTNGNMPGPSVADVLDGGNAEILWTERDWWAGSAIMWTFNGKNFDGTDMTGFPQQAPNQTSNALDTPFVLGDTDGDGDYEAWGAHTLGNNFTHYRLTALDHLGSVIFTVDLNASENIICLYFGDLDGDGVKEMFTISWLAPSYQLRAFEPNGQEKPGYPVLFHTMPSGAYEMFGSPIPADLDGDGDLEILFGYNYSSASHAICKHHDGTSFSGFPLQIATTSQLFYIGLGDVTGDGSPEMIALDNHLGSGYRVFVYDIGTGLLLPGWPYTLSDWPKGFPAVVDVDNDKVQDICFTTDGGDLVALSGAASPLAGFPKTMISPSISGVAAGDIDGDGLFELVAATWDGWVYAWDTVSTVEPGKADWPMRGVNARNTGVFGDSGSPVPDIKIDGQDGPITIPSTQTVSMTLSLDPGEEAGVSHDWWVGCLRNGTQLFSWTPVGGWSYRPGLVPLRAHGGPLFALSGFSLHQGTIPAGAWRFVFALDALNNQYEGSFKDSIQVTSY